MRRGIDLLESYDGDLIIRDGDLADTSDDVSQTYKQILSMLLKTSPGDNLIYEDLTIDLEQYAGRANTRQTGLEIERIIIEKIVRSTMLYRKEIDVETFPISETVMGIKITLLSVDSDNPGITIAYDMKDNMMRSLPSLPNEGSIKVTLPPTKMNTIF